jgi:hypothetical protein
MKGGRVYLMWAVIDIATVDETEAMSPGMAVRHWASSNATAVPEKDKLSNVNNKQSGCRELKRIIDYSRFKRIWLADDQGDWSTVGGETTSRCGRENLPSLDCRIANSDQVSRIHSNRHAVCFS